MTPLFILGHPKSGTSLLTACLDGHPGLVVCPEETDFYPAVMPHWNKLSKAGPAAMVDFLFTNTHCRNLTRGQTSDDIGGNFDYLDFDHQAFRQALTATLENAPKPIASSTLLNTFFDQLRPHLPFADAPKAFWVEKTPRHIFFLRQLLKDFPTAKFLFIYRDPRDNWVSYKKKHPKLSPYRFATTWNTAAQNALTLGTQCLSIAYRDLVMSPNSVMDRVAEYLSISQDDSLGSATKSGKPWSGNSMFDRDENSANAPATFGLDRHLQTADPESVQLVAKLCGAQFNALGHQMSPEESWPEASPHERTKLELVSIKWGLTMRLRYGSAPKFELDSIVAE